MLSELVFTIICVLTCIAVYFYFMWRIEVSDSLYWRSLAEYYQKKWDEIATADPIESKEEDPADWWRTGNQNPYGD